MGMYDIKRTVFEFFQIKYIRDEELDVLHTRIISSFSSSVECAGAGGRFDTYYTSLGDVILREIDCYRSRTTTDIEDRHGRFKMGQKVSTGVLRCSPLMRL